MKYQVYTPTELSKYKICILVTTIRKEDIYNAYLTHPGVNPDDVLVLDLFQAAGKKKTPMAEMRSYIIEHLVPIWKDMETEYVICTDAEYFKALTKSAKADANLGYVLDSEYGPKILYCPNYRAIFYDPDRIRAKISQSLDALVSSVSGSYQRPGIDIIKYAAYPQTDEEIIDHLRAILEMDCPIAIDIEAFSLKHHTAGIGTISIAWSKTEGIAFPVDYVPIVGATEAPYGMNVRNQNRRDILRGFFEILNQRAIYHAISYDVYVLIYQLFMENLLDREGLLEGLEVMLRNWDCTKLITYLATNSCAGNKLSLKDQAQEYSGNYAQSEIADITKIPLDKLLEYNLIDSLSTWFTYEKHYPTMVADDQLDIYQNIFQPAMVDIIDMQLTGMPLNMKRVKEVKAILAADEDKAVEGIRNSYTVQRYTYRLNEKWVAKRNSELKVKRVTLADANETFNPNSAPQLQDLLYTFLKLPVLALTDSKLPATDGDTLKALRAHVSDSDVKAFLENLIDYKAVNKLTTSFIPAMENAAEGPDGWHYLFGNFNLGGTLSGRLSSSEPNLQNLPAAGKSDRQRFYAKLIKSCFEAPTGWLFSGLDFNSLEDRISALTTKDPMKIKVYTDGYDGHSLRAYTYFNEQMTGIDPISVVSINSIEKLYKPLRQESKAPTFALTYQGTWKTLMTNCGFSMEKAKLIEKRYHEMYFVSDQWVAAKLDQASTDGYIVGAFGLRLRTPLLKQVIRGTSKTPYEAEAEGRTAGNALGQSWCLLNTRAGIEFNSKVRASEYRLDIRPCAQIHDAQYHLIRDDISVVRYTNEHLVTAVKWQDDPEIYHDEVKLGGDLSIFYPSWAEEIGIHNGASEEEIFAIIDQAMLAK